MSKDAVSQNDGIFETIGEFLQDSLLMFTTSAVNSITSTLVPVLGAGITLYFIVRGYLIIMGKSDGALQELLLQMGKMALVFLIALSAGQYEHYVIKGFDGISSGLTQAIAGAIPGNSNTSYKSAWGAIDSLWATYFNMSGDLTKVSDSMKSFPIIGFIADTYLEIVAILASILIIIQCIILTSISIGILFIAEFSSKFLLALGPIFFSLYLFPMTKDFFHAWLKTLLTPLFMMILIVTSLSLTSTLADKFIRLIAQNTWGDPSSISPLDLLLGSAVMCLFTIGMFLIIKQIPSLASSLSGGAQIQGAGLGEMAKNIGQGAGNVAAGGFTVAAVAANALGKTDLAENLKGKSENWAKVSSNQTAGAVFAGSMMGGFGAKPAIHAGRMGKAAVSNIRNMLSSKSKNQGE